MMQLRPRKADPAMSGGGKSRIAIPE